MESFSLFKSLLYNRCISDEKKLSKDLGFFYVENEAKDRCKRFVNMYCTFSNCV